MKRFLAMMSAVLLIICCMPGMVFAATPSFSGSGEQEVEAGDTVTITVTVSGEALLGGTATATSTGLVEFISIENRTGTTGATNGNYANFGTTDPTVTGELFKATFKVSENAKVGDTYTIKLYGTGMPIDFEKYSYTITKTLKVVCDHNYTLVSDTATCGDDGVKTYQCTKCPDTYTEVSKATGQHTWGKWTETKKAECGKEGEKTRACSVCGDVETEKIEALTHKHELISDTATCGKDGVKTYKCSLCGDTYSEVSKATGEHKYELISDTATCGKDGVKTYKCSKCGDTYTEVSKAIGNHTWAEAWNSDETGHWHVCTVCGTTSEKAEHDAEWHVTKKPTTSATGLKQNVCETCGYVLEEKVMDQLTEGELDDEPANGDLSYLPVIGTAAALMTLSAGAWLVLKRKNAR